MVLIYKIKINDHTLYRIIFLKKKPDAENLSFFFLFNDKTQVIV